MMSLVVPGIFVTIALFSSNNAFKRDDLPTLGLPIITVFSPSFIIFPVSDVSSSPFISSIDLPIVSIICWVVISSISSSGKSITASIFANILKRDSIIKCIFLDSPPSNWLKARVRAVSVLALIRSITASA